MSSRHLTPAEVEALKRRIAEMCPKVVAEAVAKGLAQPYTPPQPRKAVR